jgi:hypothetical protein
MCKCSGQCENCQNTFENQIEEEALNAKKEIGDVMVVVVILCQKLGFDLLDCLKKAHDKNNDPDRKPILYNNQIVKRRSLINCRISRKLGNFNRKK